MLFMTTENSPFRARRCPICSGVYGSAKSRALVGLADRGARGHEYALSEPLAKMRPISTPGRAGTRSTGRMAACGECLPCRSCSWSNRLHDLAQRNLQLLRCSRKGLDFISRVQCALDVISRHRPQELEEGLGLLALEAKYNRVLLHLRSSHKVRRHFPPTPTAPSGHYRPWRARTVAEWSASAACTAGWWHSRR
jgi:hypothetical protein